MARNAFRFVAFGWAITGAILAGAGFAHAQPPQGNNGGPQNGPQGGPHNNGPQQGNNGSPQTYQRRGSDGWNRGRDRRRDDFRQGYPYMSPQFNSGWYQRPYPTHLDYFRLRSNEAPPPYYGNYGYGGYGGWGPVGVLDNGGNGYTIQPSDDGTGSAGVSPRTLMMGPPSEQSKNGNSSGVQSPPAGTSESLPAPSK